jgi:hypothetical protein
LHVALFVQGVGIAASTPPEPDEEASSFVPLGVVSLALLPPLLAPEVVPGAAPRSVDPPLAHAAPTTSTASAPIAVLLEKLVEERLAQCMLLSTARTLA